MASRSLWSGSISFGLVNIPVKMFAAVREEPVRFHLLHDQDKVRLQRKLVCPADEKEVHNEHIVRGYEVAPDQYVVVQERELESIAPEKTRAIEITDFVDLAEIDPLYYDRPYYLLPDKNAGKSYHLLLQAMGKSRKVGIARFVMRNKEYLGALRPVGPVLCLSTMRFGEEVVKPRDLDEAPAKAEVGERELKAAQQLIDSLATEFEPDRYHDEYKQRVLDLIDRKAKGEEVVTQPSLPQRQGRPLDLVEALQASVAKIKGGRSEPHKGSARRSKKGE